MIYNKSTHPVEVKKISIRMWTLRSEIEAAIERRIQECEAARIPLFIDDIKMFYHLEMGIPLNEATNILKFQVLTDGVTSLMESIGEDKKDQTDKPAEAVAANPDANPAANPEASPETKLEAKPEEAKPLDPNAQPADPNQAPVAEAQSTTFNQAEAIMAQQSKEGLEIKKPNPIIDRPYVRQPPDIDQMAYGFTFLVDMNMDTFLSFTKGKFLQGQSVVVEFLIPQAFKMSARVVYCNYYALRSKIISSTKPDYRVKSQFTFTHPGERENLRKFLKSIEPSLPIERKKKKVVTEDDSLGI